MNIFTIHNGIVVTLRSDERFFAVSTYDVAHKKSSRFYVFRRHLTRWLNKETDYSFIENDLHSFLQLSREGMDHVRFRLTWLHGYGDEVKGYTQSFCVPVETLCFMLLAACEKKLLVCSETDHRQARLTLAPSAHRLAAHLDRPHRRALCKALSRAFYWGSDEHVTLYGDIGMDFCFSEEDGISGGLCCSHDYMTGWDNRKHPRITYSIHT